MKRTLPLGLIAALLAVAAPALAQNAGQIASVRRGASCAGCNLFQGDFSGLEARPTIARITPKPVPAMPKPTRIASS